MIARTVPSRKRRSNSRAAAKSDTLPSVAPEESRWRLAIDGPVMHGYLGIVIPVHRADEPCVLKVSWRDETTADEALALAAWAGRGAVRLLASDPEHAALLLERLDHQHTLSNVAIADAVEVASRLLRRLAIPAPARSALSRENSARRFRSDGSAMAVQCLGAG